MSEFKSLHEVSYTHPKHGRMKTNVWLMSFNSDVSIQMRQVGRSNNVTFTLGPATENKNFQCENFYGFGVADLGNQIDDSREMEKDRVE